MCNIGKIIKRNRIKCKVCGDIIESKRERAMRIAFAIGSIEGVPVSDETEQLYQKWVNGEMTENQLISELNMKHRK